MKRSRAFLKLMSLARIASAHVEALAKTERREVGEPDWNRGSVAGYCGIGSRYLELLANGAGIHPIFCAGEFKTYSRIMDEYKPQCGHAWLKYQGYIIDITARQFTNTVSRIERDFDKSVYVCRITNPHFAEKFVGPHAREVAAKWYVEPLDELCDKVKQVASNLRLKLPASSERSGTQLIRVR